MNEHPNSPSEINQTAFRDVTARDITANIDQSVGKTVIYQAAMVDRPIPSNVRQGSPNFVGRETELEKIHANLQNGLGVIVCAVEGMGGVGKTELALQYAQHYKDEYVEQYWLALREIGLAQAVVTLASRTFPLPESMQSAKLEEQAAWYWANWLPHEGKVLVILDDVTDLKNMPKQARPLDPRFQVLVTTRKRKLSSQFVEISLDVISESEALELLEKLLSKARVDREIVAAKAICKKLGNLPLGVELAGRYLQLDEDLRLSDYQQRLTIADESLDLQEAEELNATRGVIAAFELSWQELNANAAKVAMLLGLFAPADIAWSLVEDVAKQKKDKSLLKSLLSRFFSRFRLSQLNFDKQELLEARKQLNNLYLIKAIDEERTRFAVHSLTRQFLQWKLAQEVDLNRLFRGAFVKSLLDVAKRIPQSPTRDLIATVAPAIPHLDMLSREMLGDIPNLEEDYNLVWAFTGIAWFYSGQGLYSLAEDPYQRCLKATQELLGDRHPSVASSLNNLAALYYSQGRYAEAEPLLKQALLLLQELLGDRHPSVASSLNNLAELYRSQGRYAEAEPLYKQALLLRQEVLGEKHPSVASSLNNLAGLYDSQGRYAEAEPLFKQALLLRQELLGEKHPSVASSLNNLAGLYDSQGRYAEAEPLFKQALLLRQELLGDRHPDVAASLNNLALLYSSQGRYAEAEPLLKQALLLRQELLGDRHPNVALGINNLAKLYRSQGRYAEAEPLYQQALLLRQELLGDRHPYVASSLNNLAGLYESQGRYEEAEPLYKQALAMRQELLGDRHPDFATSINDLAGLYYAQGRYEEAKPLCKQALALWQELLGDRHPSVATSLNNLALLYSSQGKYEEAESKAQAALAIHLSVLGEDHPNTRNLLLFVKGLRVQNLLQCDQQTLFAILEALAPQANFPTLDTEAMLYLLEDIATNPELLHVLQQSMLQQT